MILLGVSRLVSKRSVDIHSGDWERATRLEWTWKLAWLYEVSKRRHQVKLHPSNYFTNILGRFQYSSGAELLTLNLVP